MQNLANNEAEISLFGVIREKTWYDEADTANSAKGFKKALDNLGNVSKIYVNINSLGGSVFEGQAIYSMLKRHSATIHVRVEGVCASIASNIAMAGDIIEAPQNCQFMIHNPSTGIWGEVKDLQKGINMLLSATEAMAAVYHEKTGIPIDEVKALMDEEKWMSGSEAVEMGFATDLSDSIEMSACADTGVELLNKYKNPPKNITAFANPKPPEPTIDAGSVKIDYDLIVAKVVESLESNKKKGDEDQAPPKIKKKNSLKNALKAMSS